MDKINKVGLLGVNRRAFLGTSAAITLGGLSPMSLSAPRRQLEELSSAEKWRTYVRLIGSLESTTIFTWFSGHLWGIVPGTAPKPLVTFEGLAKGIWEDRGREVDKESFDIGFFGDLETGQVIHSFDNPYTGKSVAPYHYAYGGGGKTTYSENGVQSGNTVKPIETNWVRSGDQVWLDEYFSASFDNPFNPEEWPLSSAGERVHFGSSTTYVARSQDLFNVQLASCPHTFFWTAVNSWEPWLHMGESPGYVMWRGTGRKLKDLSEASETIRNYISEQQPNYFDPGRPWEGRRSTWLSYMDARRPERK